MYVTILQAKNQTELFYCQIICFSLKTNVRVFRGCDSMVVVFTAIYAISAYHH
jgi:hypothetical protein